MGNITVIRFMALYVPVLACVGLTFLRPMAKRTFPAALMGFIWTLPSLLAIQLLNLYFGWWRFNAQGGLFCGMPIDLYLGWAVLWGILPVLAFRDYSNALVVGIFFLFDLIVMPACAPLVTLTHRWLVGEFTALGLVLLPAQLFARWTLVDSHLKARAALHVMSAAGVFLFVIPEIGFSLQSGRGWDALLCQAAWLRNLQLQAVALLGVLGVSAVQEFAQRGEGTPIPYDPPRRLVISGVYRYVSNPMQLSCALVMTCWGAVLRNPMLVGGGVIAAVYSIGIASWDESEDMRIRFGNPWKQYRRNVPAWKPRLTAWHAPDREPARLYISEMCGPCSEVRHWFESRAVVGLLIIPAEDHPTWNLRRITYDPMDGSHVEEGVHAFARGLEHTNLGWMFAGACLRLPGISHFIQILLDGTGLGPRVVARRECVQNLGKGSATKRGRQWLL